MTTLTQEPTTRWTPEEKLQLVLDSYQADNVQAFCRERGIDRSYLYQLRREHEQFTLEGWRSRKVGRPRNETDGEPLELKQALEESRERYRELESEAAKLRVQAEMGHLLADWVDQRTKSQPKKKPSSWRPKRLT
jgi:transposase-like protein